MQAQGNFSRRSRQITQIRIQESSAESGKSLCLPIFCFSISLPAAICVNLRLIHYENSPEEIEQYRDRKWRREESLKIDTAEEVEAMVEELGFCLGLTDIRKALPSVYIAVCGRRDAHMPRNVQKDYEASRAWVLKDEVIARGKLYYAKLIKGKSWFLAPRMIPVFNSIWGCSRKGESAFLSKNAQLVLKVLRKEWEMATADLREECGFKDKKDLTNAMDELQRRMKVVPQEVVYVPKFTYIWTLAEARFPEELRSKCRVKTPFANLPAPICKCAA